MGVAYDFSYEHPTAGVLRGRSADGVLVYDRATTPDVGTLVSYRNASLKIAFIHEEYGTEASEGYDRGVQAAIWANEHIPTNTIVYVNAWDGPHTPSQLLENVRRYFYGFGETWRDPLFGAYGNDEAVTMAYMGHPKCRRLWGVETWVPRPMTLTESLEWHGANGYGLVQIANYHTIPGTDDNITLTDAWAQMVSDKPSDPALIKRRINKHMWIAMFADSGWCDVWYNGRIVDGFTNKDVNGFNVGPVFQRYLDQGAGWTMYPNAENYGVIRDSLLAS